MFLNNDNRITFIIDSLCTIGFPYKGASFVIHKLAYEIANYGYQVYMFNEPMYPHQNIGVIKTTKESFDDGWTANFTWEYFAYDPNKTVTIYTNMTWGNPFNTIHNCRWFLSDYDEDKWDTHQNDYIYNIGSFKVPTDNQKKLTIVDYNTEKFFDKKNKDRSGFGYLKHKFTPDWGDEFVNKLGASVIPIYNGQVEIDYLVEEFNKYEYIITFDDKTYYSVLAALCGTKVIVIPQDNKLTPTEYRILNPTMMCGVAYGFDDIEWANKTIGLVRENIKSLKKIDQRTIFEFINFWENKILQ